MTSATQSPNLVALSAPSNRIGLAQTIHDTLIMAQRGLLKIRRTPEQLFDVTLQPVIFTLLFTFVFGGAIAGNVAAYLPIVIPGILVQTVVAGSSATGTQLREDMDKGVFDRFRTLPIARIAPLAGALTADIVRYLIAITITLLMGALLGWRPGGGAAGIAGAVLLLVACAWAVSWIFAFIGVISRSAGSVQGISLLILFPLTFLSNAFVPADTLPEWLQRFVAVNPITHLINALRELLNQGAFGQEGLLALLGAAGIVAIMAPLAVGAYKARV